VIQPLNGDPFVSMLETPVTSSPLVVSYLSNLPAYRTGVSPLLRGVEIGLAHGFFLPGPFIKVRRVVVSWWRWRGVGGGVGVWVVQGRPLNDERGAASALASKSFSSRCIGRGDHCRVFCSRPRSSPAHSSSGVSLPSLPGSPPTTSSLHHQPAAEQRAPNAPPSPHHPTPQLGPLRAVEGTAEIAGCLSAAGLVGILALCLTLYGAASFQTKAPLGVKTLSGRAIERDSLQSGEG